MEMMRLGEEAYLAIRKKSSCSRQDSARCFVAGRRSESQGLPNSGLRHCKWNRPGRGEDEPLGLEGGKDRFVCWIR